MVCYVLWHHCWLLRLFELGVDMDDELYRFYGENVELELHVLLHRPIVELVRPQCPELKFSWSLQHLLSPPSDS